MHNIRIKVFYDPPNGRHHKRIVRRGQGALENTPTALPPDFITISIEIQNLVTTLPQKRPFGINHLVFARGRSRAVIIVN